MSNQRKVKSDRHSAPPLPRIQYITPSKDTVHQGHSAPPLPRIQYITPSKDTVHQGHSAPPFPRIQGITPSKDHYIAITPTSIYLQLPPFSTFHTPTSIYLQLPPSVHSIPLPPSIFSYPLQYIPYPYLHRSPATPFKYSQMEQSNMVNIVKFI